MATHSSTLAWRTPWTEEPGGLQSMGPQESDTTERLNHHGQRDEQTHKPAQPRSRRCNNLWYSGFRTGYMSFFMPAIRLSLDEYTASFCIKVSLNVHNGSS